MGLSIPHLPGRQELTYTGALLDIIHELDDLAAAMASGEFDKEAHSLNTVAEDLRWQCEELVRREQLAAWPNGPRRLSL